MEGINVLWISLAAFLGGALSGTVGYLSAGEQFAFRKYCATLITALIAGIGFALAYQLSGSEVTWVDILTAVFAGAGGDALVNRIAKLKT